MSRSGSSWKHWLVVVSVLGVLAAGCSSSDDGDAGESNTPEPAAAADPVALDSVAFDADGCDFNVQPGFEADCGWVEVPQHWNDGSDPDTIRLHVATFTNDQTPADATPVVYLEGGPGGDVFGGLELTLDVLWGDLIDEHPLVVFTQRGTQRSDVDLHCEETIEETVRSWGRTPDLEAEEERFMAALTSCAERLIEEGADFSAYDTVSSANDAEAIRLALGFDQWNVLGISYGTRLGQEILRLHPDGVAAAILDSVQPTDPALGGIGQVPITYQGAFNEMVAACEADAACAALTPDFEPRLRAVIEQADETPFETEALNQLTGESFPAIVDGDRLSSLLFNALYSPTIFAAVPKMVNELEVGNTATLELLTGLAITNADFVSQGHFVSVMCQDFFGHLNEDDLAAGLTGDALFDGLSGEDQPSELESLQQGCAIFDPGVEPAAVTEPITTDVPVLLLSGRFDPITPPSFADAIATGLTNHQNVVHPNQGHGVSQDPCGMEIALGFLADPKSPVDTSCLADSATPPFTPASLENLEFEPFEEALLGVTGVRPTGWIDQGFGVSAEDSSNIADQLVLLQQAVPVPAEQLLSLFGEQLGGEFSAGDSIEVAGTTWEVAAAETAVGNAVMWTRSEGAVTLAVGLISGRDLTDAEANLIPTVLENLTLAG